MSSLPALASARLPPLPQYAEKRMQSAYSGFQRVGVGDAEEHLEAADGVALRHQRLRERQRLGVCLAPHHRVAGTDDGAEVERVQFEFCCQDVFSL